MTILLMLDWWYTTGWLRVLQNIGARLQTVSQVFAVKVLLRTWFAPWKQIYVQSTFTTFFRNMVDNTISRVIGGIIRGAILFAAGILSIFIIVFGILSFVVWPLIPLAIIIFPILSIVGVFV